MGSSSDTVYVAKIDVIVDDSTVSASLNRLRAQLQSNLNGNKQAISGLSSEFSKLKSSIANAMGGSGKSISSLSNDLGTLRSSIDDAMLSGENGTKAFEQKLESLQQKIEQTKNSVNSLAQSSSNISTKISASKSTSTTVTAPTVDTSNMNAKLGSTGDEVNKLNSQFKTLQSTATAAMDSGTKGANKFSGSITDLAVDVGVAYASLKGLETIGDVIGDLTNTYSQYEAAMNGVRAVAEGTSNSVAGSMQVIKDVTASGLISQEDAAASVKNLLSYGYTVEQTSQLITVMADAAAYNRQANYSLSEAVRVTTEGIRMENSVLSDASGVQKNIAKMYEDYAKSIGKSTKELNDAEKAQAVYNGFMAEGSMYAGNAAEVANTLAGAQSRLANEINMVKASIGSVIGEALTPFVSGLADWISRNEKLVATVATFVGVLIGGGGLAVAIVKAGQVIKTIISVLKQMFIASQLASKGILGIATAAAGIAATAVLMSDFGESTEVVATEMGSFGKKCQQAITNLRTTASATDNTTKKLKDLHKQLNNLDRDYQRSLKEIAVKHEENLADLTTQIEEANVEYRQAIDERMADFNVSMAEQERSHQETVDELMTQLSFLQRYNNDYNKQKLTQVQFALAKEEELYRRETDAQKAEIELQNQADKQKLDARLASLQEELNDELEFMNKHRADLNSVRHVILLDEVESLKERYEAQKASLQEQVEEAGESGKESVTAFDEGWEKNASTLSGLIRTDYKKEGTEAAKSYGSGFDKGFIDYIGEGGFIKSIWEGLLGKERYDRWTSGKGLFYGGWADGGYTGPGPKNEVAGVVHRGEYVIPKEDVDQNTGLPKTGSSVNQTFVFNLSGVLATSQQAKRDLAEELKRAFDQTNQARLA